MPKPPPRMPGDGSPTAKDKKNKKKNKNTVVRGRQTTQNVKTAKYRKTSSTLWLRRQLNDPYVAEAQRRGYRSRAAFKLLQIDDRFKILKKGQRVVDLGAAPGGWTQILVDKLKPEHGNAHIVALDILDMEEMSGATVLKADFEDHKAVDMLHEALGKNGRCDLVVSDMSPFTSGHPQTDHIRIMNLVELAYDFTKEVLDKGGVFVAKVFHGGAEEKLLKELRHDFKRVKHFKPEASRKSSAETYVVAMGYKGES